MLAHKDICEIRSIDFSECFGSNTHPGASDIQIDSLIITLLLNKRYKSLLLILDVLFDFLYPWNNTLACLLKHMLDISLKIFELLLELFVYFDGVHSAINCMILPGATS